MPDESADAPAHDDEPRTAATPSERRQPSARRNLWQWAGPVALAVALIAIVIAVWALRQPAAPDAESPTSQQSADAKVRACNAYKTVRTAVSLETSVNLGPDPVAMAAAAANGRLAMVTGSSYLITSLDPATPAELKTAIRSFADDLQEIAIIALAGVGNDDPAQKARLGDAEAMSGQIAGLCK
jgi:hypothetical protein